MGNEWEKLPEKFVERLRLVVPASRLRAVLDSFSRRRETTLRTNRLKITSEELREKLSSQGFNLTAVRSLPDAFILRGGRDSRDLTKTVLYGDGCFYLQSLSSMLPAIVLNPQPGESVLDLAAAPGSKTTQMASLMGNRGQITAVEVSRVRLYKLLANLKTQGATNVRVLNEDGRFLYRSYPNTFDRVLLDAPCSTEGRFLTFDPSTFSHWSKKYVEKSARLQKSLIFSALASLKIGGVLVYSTCTFSPEENEAVIDFALTKFKGGVKVEKLSLDLANAGAPLASFGGTSFAAGVSEARRIFPNENFEGFFLCQIRKIS